LRFGFGFGLGLGFGLVLVVVEELVVEVELDVTCDVVGDEVVVADVVVAGAEVVVVGWVFELPLQATASAATSPTTTAVAACLARMHVPFTDRGRTDGQSGSRARYRGCHGSDC
jgi:hypothetical protein